MYGEIILYGLCFLSIVTFLGTIYLVYSCCFNNKEKTDEPSENAGVAKTLDEQNPRKESLGKNEDL